MWKSSLQPSCINWLLWGAVVGFTSHHQNHIAAGPRCSRARWNPCVSHKPRPRSLHQGFISGSWCLRGHIAGQQIRYVFLQCADQTTRLLTVELWEVWLLLRDQSVVSAERVTWPASQCDRQTVIRERRSAFTGTYSWVSSALDLMLSFASFGQEVKYKETKRHRDFLMSTLYRFILLVSLNSISTYFYCLCSIFDSLLISFMSHVLNIHAGIPTCFHSHSLWLRPQQVTCSYLSRWWVFSWFCSYSPLCL